MLIHVWLHSLLVLILGDMLLAVKYPAMDRDRTHGGMYVLDGGKLLYTRREGFLTRTSLWVLHYWSYRTISIGSILKWSPYASQASSSAELSVSSISSKTCTLFRTCILSTWRIRQYNLHTPSISMVHSRGKWQQIYIYTYGIYVYA